MFPSADPKLAEHLLFAVFAAAALRVLAAAKGRLGYPRSTTQSRSELQVVQ
ncbi:hypothetical protein [Amycolatopsis echigonensis]|uniref:Uncharacterized protein n=1 Tax=Amycolatopsis echigonensis TaxID=2576905 RepID=A0A8E1W8R6_9PSEU|nr:hypothetical protein [Amycolatopsis echigonensis]MBB2505692.1 hypothetical protein [Amycolatopsis echigonensis]